MRFLLIVFVFGVFLFTSCANESDPTADKAAFTRIYDNDRFDASFYPIDMKQTPDGGYLILGGRRIQDSNFTGIYLMKTDEFGAYVSEMEVDETYVNPVGPLLENGGNYYFFGMTSTGLQTQLFQLDTEGTLSDPISVGGTYPAAAAVDGSNFLLLSYDNLNKLSVVSVVSPAGSVIKSKGFSIGAGDAAEEPIINHFLRTGTTLPFVVGKTPAGQYFFNGFYNYTLSLVFTDLQNDNPQGVVQGQQDDGGLSQVVPQEGGKFALARFNFGDNYYLPNTTLNTTGISSSTDLGGNPFPELVNNAPVKILRLTVNTKKIVLYGSNTRNNQIAVYGYDEATGEFLGSRYLGFSNSFEIASITPTADGGLGVCGTTHVAGRFPRICLFKLSQEQLIESFQ